MQRCQPLLQQGKQLASFCCLELVGLLRVPVAKTYQVFNWSGQMQDARLHQVGADLYTAPPAGAAHWAGSAYFAAQGEPLRLATP